MYRLCRRFADVWMCTPLAPRIMGNTELPEAYRSMHISNPGLE